VLDYRALGYLPDAILNFVALIGWSPGGDREVMKRDELIEAFDLGGLQPSSGIFDIEKLRWMNGTYIRETPTEELVKLVEEHINDSVALDYYNEPAAEGDVAKPDVLPYFGMMRRALTTDRTYASQTIALEQERVHTLSDFGTACAFFFEEEPPMDEKAVNKWFGQPHVGALFDLLISRFSEATTASVEWCESLIRDYAADNTMEKLGPVVHPVRVALTGKTVGPGLFELMHVLGPARMVARLQKARALVK
jgi:glutamyl-tRNA synthetase